MGFSSREGVVASIDNNLTATCLILANEAQKVAIIPLDLAALPLDVSFRLRQRIGAAIGTAASHVLLNFNHTHSAPAFPGWLPETAAQYALQQQYQDMMMAQVIEVASKANQSLQDARIAAGWGACYIGINRREMGADGLVFLGENPTGPIDPAVGVMRVDDLSGRPIAITFSYGCHTVVNGPRSLAASPDFPGAARETIEKTIGGTALFLQACGGNIMPIDGMGYEVDCRDSVNRIGAILGGEVVKVAAGLRTHVKRGKRTALTSLSGISLWPWVPVEEETCTYLGAVAETFPLDFIDFPSLAEAEELRGQQLQKLTEAQASGNGRDIGVATRFVDWADKLIDAIRSGRKTLDMVIQAIRVNDIVLATLSVESFAETGLTIKALSPSPHTQVLGYSNGYSTYLPRKQDYPAGGWDIHVRYKIPDLLFQAVSVPTAIHPDSEERVVQRTLALIGHLAS